MLPSFHINLIPLRKMPIEEVVAALLYYLIHLNLSFSLSEVPSIQFQFSRFSSVVSVSLAISIHSARLYRSDSND